MKFIFLLIAVLALSGCGNWEDEDYSTSLKPIEPKRLVIDGEVHLSDLEKLGSYTHVEFAKDGILITNGMDFILNLQELRSYNGTIMTFDEDTIAPNDNNGKNGGNIIIKAAKAIGNLHVILRGQNAGIRTDEPAALGEAGRGSTGGRGHDGRRQCYEPYPEPDPRPRPIFKILKRRKICSCARQPGSGGRGGPGKKGRTGFKGYKGGASGNAEILIDDGSDFTLTYERIVGQGGTGSRGGIGGPGGHGGAPGNCPRNCRPADYGHQGPNGIRGDQGLTGDEGDTGKICLKLSSDSAKYCF